MLLFKELSKFIYKNRGVFILVDPYLIENLRDANGRVIKNYNNSVIVKMLGKLGISIKVIQQDIQIKVKLGGFLYWI